MKLFPFILARIGGLPFDLLEQLSLQSKHKLEAVFEQDSLIERHKNELLRLIEESPKNIHCGFVLKNFGYLKNNLLQGKKPKLSGKLNLNLKESEQSFFKKIEGQLKLYNQVCKDLKDFEKDFEIVYQNEISTARVSLQKISHEPIILNGLLMSSHTFLKQLEKYRHTEIPSFTKKQFQTERTFLRYLSRICSKTSPFSTFTPLSIFSLDAIEPLNFEPKSVFRLNNHLFTLWRDALNQYPPFYRKLIVSLNPSLKIVGNNWVYLLNTRNVESIQNIEKNELLDLIFENLNEVGGKTVFEDLTTIIHPSVDTNLESLEAYLLELVDYGFLEWQWAFSGLDPIWDIKLLKVLENFKEDPFLERFITVLKDTHKNIKLAENSDYEKRKKLQLDSYKKLMTISESLLQGTQTIENEQVIDVNKLKHFKSNRFLFAPEKILYEDVKIPFDINLKVSELTNLIIELDRVLEYLDSLYFNSRQLHLKRFFVENYQKSQSVDVLSFYENYYKKEAQSDQIENQKAVAMRLAWQDKIIKNDAIKDGVLNIELDLLKTLSKINKPSAAEKQPSRGAFVQLIREENLLKGFTETSFEGNGKMMGRFLHLFSSKITKALQEWNEKQRNDLLWIENVDASIYNPNLHPPLLPFEIRAPGSQNTMPVESQISIRDLVIVYNESEDVLNLFHEPTGKKAYIFDLGFEALESRSPLYQLLATFNYQSSSQNILSEIVNNYFGKNGDQKIHFQPRICVGKQLVIQRKRWFVDLDYLPLKENSDLESIYFIRINQWIKKNKIPSKVFITIKPSELQNGEREKTDEYKPQYIDFQCPVFVQLFHKLIKKVENKLKIEEILPFPAEEIRDEKYVSEYLIQWETKAQ